jgi:hypothetical protein
MNELDQCINDIAMDDVDLKESMVLEIQEHLNGMRPYEDLTYEAQRAIDVWTTMNADEVHYNEQFNHPGYDDSDGMLEEECE